MLILKLSKLRSIYPDMEKFYMYKWVAFTGGFEYIISFEDEDNYNLTHIGCCRSEDEVSEIKNNPKFSNFKMVLNRNNLKQKRLVNF